MDYFAKNIRVLRKSRNLKQSDLSDLLGISRTAITNYEKGVSKPEYKNLEKILNYFNVTHNDILTKDLELLERNVILSNALGTDILTTNSEKIKTDSNPFLKDWSTNPNTTGLFNTYKDGEDIWKRGLLLMAFLNEAVDQQEEIYFKNVNLILERYGSKNPNNRDNTQFFKDNDKELREMERFLNIYSKSFDELKKAVLKSRTEFNIE